MLSVREAESRIAERMPSWPIETIAVDAVVGRVLAEDVEAERDQPPFDRVTMDGIAVRLADGVPADGWRVQAVQAAGQAPLALAAGACIEIMTGAVLPQGADCVVPVEQIDVAAGRARLQTGIAPQAGQFIHRRGSDRRAGATVLVRGQRLRAPEIAVLAGHGRAQVDVASRPRMTVISTGDELVPAGRPIEPHQIRSCNGAAIRAALLARGLPDCSEEWLPDDAQRLRERLAARLAASDVLILTGGVSMGKFDYLPGVLESLGVELVFHKVAQRPGKPMWFGMAGARAIFALPGNPVSSLVCLYRYVLPALDRAAGLAPPESRGVVLGEPLEFAAPLTAFVPVHLRADAGHGLRAIPAPTNTSGDYTALAGTDGFIELPAEEQHFAAGRVAPFWAW